MYGKLVMTCLKYQVKLYGSEAIIYLIFECFPMGGNRASAMSHQTTPIPHFRQPSPLSVWQQNCHPFGREL
jgi:hypothetical protein